MPWVGIAVFCFSNMVFPGYSYIIISQYVLFLFYFQHFRPVKPKDSTAPLPNIGGKRSSPFKSDLHVTNSSEMGIIDTAFNLLTNSVQMYSLF